MLTRLGSFAARGGAAFVGTLRDALEKLIELPRNIKQSVLLLLDMVFVTAAMRYSSNLL